MLSHCVALKLIEYAAMINISKIAPSETSGGLSMVFARVFYVSGIIITLFYGTIMTLK